MEEEEGPQRPLSDEEEDEEEDEGLLGSRKPQAKQRRDYIPPIQRSLALLLQSMTGRVVSVELKCDVDVTGVIDEADCGMK
jgi:hypothetical protein